jgi:hypothetical protein
MAVRRRSDNSLPSIQACRDTGQPAVRAASSGDSICPEHHTKHCLVVFTSHSQLVELSGQRRDWRSLGDRLTARPVGEMVQEIRLCRYSGRVIADSDTCRAHPDDCVESFYSDYWLSLWAATPTHWNRLKDNLQAYRTQRVSA